MKRIVVISERCDGCGECVRACERRNGAPACYLEKQTEGGFRPLLCHACTQPACLDTCMSGALYRDPDSGNLRYDIERCASCYMCVMACPYGMPAPRADRGVARCDLCALSAEGSACVRACPRGALILERVKQ